MKYSAVIFDLFGTLVDSPSRVEHLKILDEMASILSVPHQQFTQLWFDTSSQRTTGIIKSPEENIEHICRQLGMNFTDNQLKHASRIRLNFILKLLKPRPDALDTLGVLKNQQYKIGLISDCSSEVPTVWKDTPFAAVIDVPVFSCVARMKKPDPRIYWMSLDKFGVEAGDCLYIGDGSSHELSGAQAVGMHPVMIRVPYEASQNPDRIDEIDEDEWDGIVISSLNEVLDLVK